MGEGSKEANSQVEESGFFGYCEREVSNLIIKEKDSGHPIRNHLSWVDLRGWDCNLDQFTERPMLPYVSKETSGTNSKDANDIGHLFGGEPSLKQDSELSIASKPTLRTYLKKHIRFIQAARMRSFSPASTKGNSVVGNVGGKNFLTTFKGEEQHKVVA